jgi:histidine phosphotransferase ChpT
VDKTLIRRAAANRSLLMSSIFTLTPSDLASLLCSKVCHDIISPVGAINNGLELLDEGGADEAAMDLIKTSARNASARLQFARIAFGAAGSAGVQIDTGDAQSVADRIYARRKGRNSPGPATAPTCRRTRSNCC